MARQSTKQMCALLLGTSLIAVATPAWAQPAAEEDSSALGEILVTANKREENLQQAPLAISAVSAEALEFRGLSEAKDLSAIAPNVSVVGATTNATAAVVSIRGIPSPADETQGFDSPIGMYLDGVYLARSSAATFEVADIERVEVLRGPQGTLFGRNTTGGAINFITKKPSDDASFKLRLGGGNYGQMNIRGILNSGDLGGARLSLGFLHRERNGIVNNLLEPKKSRDPGAHTVDSVRAAFEIDLSDSVSVYNVFDMTRITALPHVSQLAAVGDGTVRPNVTLNGNTFAAVQPSNVGGFLAASTVLEPGCGKLVTRVRQSTVCNELDDTSTDEIWGNLFRIEADLGAVTVRSSSAYRSWRNKIRGSDLDGLGTLRGPLFSSASLLNGMPTALLSLALPVAQQPFAPFIAATPVPTTVQPLFSATNNRRQHQYSQELEVVSTGDGPFQWVLGAFYFKEKGYERNDQTIGFVLDTNPIFLGNFGGLGPSFVTANPARYRVVPTFAALDYRVGGESKAVYGQFSYRPGGKEGPLGVTLGLRYTWDKKNVNRTQNGATAFSAAEQALNVRAAKFSAPSGHLTVDYRASDDVNLYARVARGYRSGGFNLRQSTQLDNPATTTVNEAIGLIPFNEETIWSYEVGAKMEFMRRIRLNVAAFHNIYTDQLATIPIPITGGGSFGTQVVNAGKTTYTGFEAEGQFKISDNFSIDGNVGYINIKIKEFPGADTTGVIRNIAPLITGQGYAPKYTASIAGNVTVPVGADSKVTGRLGYNYTSGFEMFPNSLTAPFSKATRGDARGLLDGQLRYEGLFGQKASLTVWGKNLTNKKYVTRSVDFGQLGFATVIFGDPRTYGLTLDMEF
ncbi:MAG TPA: TonB-dependent receptor [Chakrabartia sp.]|jgi:iron complex outermembrane receptor protein|nr:TonB-dependent receptor [Chakrabartia sp.]